MESLLEPEVLEAAGRSIFITSTAIFFAAVVGIPAGLMLGRWKSGLQRQAGWTINGQSRSLRLENGLANFAVLVARASMAFPTVFLGVVCFGLLSRQGPLAPLELLYTPTAIILGEFLLALPIIVALTQQPISQLAPAAIETAATLRTGRLRLNWLMLNECRDEIVLAVLTAFARCITELGIAMIVGGNIRGQTRTLATATAMEVSQGEFSRAFTMGLILLSISLLVALVVGWLQHARRHKTVRQSQDTEKELELGPQVNSIPSGDGERATREIFQALQLPANKPPQLLASLARLDVARHGQPVAQIREMSIQSGQHLALVGANGSGKSTLLLILAGLIRHPAVTQAGSGGPRLIVHQSPYLFRDTVAHNLRFGLSGRQFSMLKNLLTRGACFENDGNDGGGDASLQLIAELWRDFELTPLLNRRVHELSGGERRRVALVRALNAIMALSQADRAGALLLLDEPFADLDQKFRKLFSAWLGQLPCAVLITSPVTLDIKSFGEVQPFAVGS